MDRMLYIATSGAKEAMIAQALNANNLANAATTGFKADRHEFRAMLVEGPGWDSRAYSLSERPATDLRRGDMDYTGNPMDITSEQGVYFQVQGQENQPGLVTTASLRVNPDGSLTDAQGRPILSTDGGPIVLPPFNKISIGTDGSINIVPAGSPETERAIVAQIAMVKPDPKTLEKGLDGLLYPKPGAPEPQIEAGLKLKTGFLEGSNVNTAQAMIQMIEFQRKYDLQVKMMQTAKKHDQVSDKMLANR